MTCVYLLNTIWKVEAGVSLRFSGLCVEVLFESPFHDDESCAMVGYCMYSCCPLLCECFVGIVFCFP